MEKSHQSIAELAYSLWQQRGSPYGSSEADWQPAELQLAVNKDPLDESLEESFPASDPPGSSLPDYPPSNANAKQRPARQSKGRTSSL